MNQRDEKLRGVAEALEDILKEIYGERMGFTLIVTPFWEPVGIGDYISNVQREDMIKELRHMAEQIETSKDIPPPIGRA